MHIAFAYLGTTKDKLDNPFSSLYSTTDNEIFKTVFRKRNANLLSTDELCRRIVDLCGLVIEGYESVANYNCLISLRHSSAQVPVSLPTCISKS